MPDGLRESHHIAERSLAKAEFLGLSAAIASIRCCQPDRLFLTR